MRTKKGIITSAKMNRTVTVTVHTQRMHPVYKKRFRTSKKFLADSGEHELHEGDFVVITECRPLSKRKHFKVTSIIKHAAQTDALVEEEALTATLQKTPSPASPSSPHP